MKYLIVGIGNIGEAYENTRHNIGFAVLDKIAEDNNLIFKQERYAYVCKYKFKSRNFVLAKPTTYVNLSGKAIKYWLTKEKIPIEKMMIILDDLSLPFGSIRIREKGGDAGHNGLIDIINVLGHNKFNRLRFGIGNEFDKGKQIEHVLGKWTASEKKALPERLDMMIEAIKSFGTIGIERTMNFYNGK